MKLSKQTLELFKNFGLINSNLLIKSGSNIATIAPVTKDIYAEATLEENFPKQAGIYNIFEFLNVVRLFSDPEFIFDNNHVIIKEGSKKINYVYSEPNLLAIPEKKLIMPTAEVSFSLSDEQIGDLQKAAYALKAPDLVMTGDGKNVIVKVKDIKNPTSSDFEIELAGATDRKFTVKAKIEKLKLFEGGYNVSLSSKKIAKFEHKSIQLSYFIAVDSSEYEKS